MKYVLLPTGKYMCGDVSLNVKAAYSGPNLSHCILNARVPSRGAGQDGDFFSTAQIRSTSMNQHRVEPPSPGSNLCVRDSFVLKELSGLEVRC